MSGEWYLPVCVGGGHVVLVWPTVALCYLAFLYGKWCGRRNH